MQLSRKPFLQTAKLQSKSSFFFSILPEINYILSSPKIALLYIVVIPQPKHKRFIALIGMVD